MSSSPPPSVKDAAGLQPPAPTLDQHLCFKLYATSLKMTQLYKPLLSELKLTYPQYLVMVLLWERQGLGIKDVAARLEQDPGSITPLVKRLEAEGYLVRDRNPRDARNRVLTLTAAGRQLRLAAVGLSQAIAAACAIAPDELSAMSRSLNSLNKRLSG